MPKEITDKEHFGKQMESATEIWVARQGEDAKETLRTKDALYTFKTTSADADALLKGTKVPVVEF